MTLPCGLGIGRGGATNVSDTPCAVRGSAGAWRGAGLRCANNASGSSCPRVAGSAGRTTRAQCAAETRGPTDGRATRCAATGCGQFVVPPAPDTPPAVPTPVPVVPLVLDPPPMTLVPLVLDVPPTLLVAPPRLVIPPVADSPAIPPELGTVPVFVVPPALAVPPVPDTPVVPTVSVTFNVPPLFAALPWFDVAEMLDVPPAFVAPAVPVEPPRL